MNVDSEFKIVKYKRSKKRQRRTFNIPKYLVADDIIQPAFEISRKIESARAEIRQSLYYTDLVLAIQSQLGQHCLGSEQGSASISEILCYGVGNFSTSVCARYQFALLVNLTEDCKSEVYIYDPVFNNTELELLKNVYNLHVILADEQGKRSVSAEGKLTFVYFPHCPNWLVNNFLWKNWSSRLNTCLLFSNSFNEIITNTCDVVLKSELRYLHKIALHCVEELKINNSFKFDDIFNNLSLHTFPKDKIDFVLKDSTFELVEPFRPLDALE